MHIDSLNELKKILPPPAKPVAASGDWSAAERTIGTALPEDYKEFISVFGLGSVGRHLWVNSPFTSKSDYELKPFAELTSENYLAYEEQGLFKSDLPIWPKPGGVLAFGCTENSYYLNWLTAGNPNDWPVVIFDADYMQFRQTRPGLSATNFLVSLLDGSSELFEIGAFSGLKNDKPVFTPIE